MKAKELVEKHRLRESKDLDDFNNRIIDVVGDLVREVAALAKMRRAKSSDAIISIIKELERKFRAVLDLYHKGTEADAELQEDMWRKNYRLIFQAIFQDALFKDSKDLDLVCNAMDWDPENPFLLKRKERGA